MPVDLANGSLGSSLAGEFFPTWVKVDDEKQLVSMEQKQFRLITLLCLDLMISFSMSIRWEVIPLRGFWKTIEVMDLSLVLKRSWLTTC